MTLEVQLFLILSLARPAIRVSQLLFLVLRKLQILEDQFMYAGKQLILAVSLGPFPNSPQALPAPSDVLEEMYRLRIPPKHRLCEIPA